MVFPALLDKSCRYYLQVTHSSPILDTCFSTLRLTSSHSRLLYLLSRGNLINYNNHVTFWYMYVRILLFLIQSTNAQIILNIISIWITGSYIIYTYTYTYIYISNVKSSWKFSMWCKILHNKFPTYSLKRSWGWTIEVRNMSSHQVVLVNLIRKQCVSCWITCIL